MKTLLTTILSLISLIGISQSLPQDSTSTEQKYSYIIPAGLTRTSAIPIDSRTDQEGIPLEYKWIRKHYPNSKIITFDMEGNGEFIPSELYDIYLIKTVQKRYIRIYFKVLYFNVNI